MGNYRGIGATASTSTREAVLLLAYQRGVIGPQDLVARDLNPKQLARLARRGLLTRVARGLYASLDAPVSEHHALAEAARLYPKAVVCLLSALQFHGLTTQAPYQVWLAIDVKAWKPTRGGAPVRWMRSSGAALTSGIEVHELEGAPVRIYSPAKTVVDCFKFRSKVGLDVALEALRDYRARRGSVDDLWHYARICRVRNVMQPYLEAIG